MSAHDPPGTAKLPAATVDLDRRRRCGFPEVVYGPGKTSEQVCQIVATLVEHGEPVLVTRVDESQAAALLGTFPTGRHNKVARTFRLAAGPSLATASSEKPRPSLKGRGN